MAAHTWLPIMQDVCANGSPSGSTSYARVVTKRQPGRANMYNASVTGMLANGALYDGWASRARPAGRE
jgi:hypothetical protein